jgi:D-alanine-D-alanine ligase
VSAGPPLTVAVLAGGRSSEHEVSLASGRSVAAGLAAAGHGVIWIEIGRDGHWRRDQLPVSVTPGAGLMEADVVFPALHGAFGEDGTVQGLLEMLDVPYVGAGVTASAVCMDKVLFKELMSVSGVPQVAFAAVRAEDWRTAGEAALARLRSLGLPVFVKPAHLGSSLGIAKVSTAAALAGALEVAFTHDALVIVEAMAHGLEVECSVVGRTRSERAGGADAALASQPGEIVLRGRDWYDYEAKYTPGAMELVVPARLPADVRERVCELAVRTFLRADCDGLARVDFFIAEGEVLVNELNTMPGFTDTSVFAALFEASGIPYAELVDRLCRLALERHAARRGYTY